MAGPGAHWALLRDGSASLRRADFDVATACAVIGEQSSFPDVMGWADYFLHARASDGDALGGLRPSRWALIQRVLDHGCWLLTEMTSPVR